MNGKGSGAQRAALGHAAGGLTFIERFIERYYMRQPKWVRSVVFIFFSLLFSYSFIQFLDGKHTLDTYVGVPLSHDDLINKKALLPTGHGEAYKPAPPGYCVVFDEREYATNSHGWLRLDLDPLEYADVLATGRLKVKVSAPEIGMVDYEIVFDRLSFTLHRITLSPLVQMGAKLSPAHISAPPTPFIDLASAFASEPASDRLFIRSVTLPKDIESIQDLSVTLAANGHAASLKGGEYSDLANGDSRLPVFGQTSVYDYTWYIEIPNGLRSGKVTIRSNSGLFRLPYEEEFPFGPSEYGVLQKVSGSRGSTLVLQRMQPWDVVLFERLGTTELDAKVSSELTRAGLVVRVNSGSSKVPGEYNAVYSGNEVPFQTMQQVIQGLDRLGLRLKSLQHNLTLKSPKQNQIQIGSNVKFGCLEPLGSTIIQQLTNSKNEAEFAHIIEKSRPKLPCVVNQ